MAVFPVLDPLYFLYGRLILQFCEADGIGLFICPSLGVKVAAKGRGPIEEFGKRRQEPQQQDGSDQKKGCPLGSIIVFCKEGIQNSGIEEAVHIGGNAPAHGTQKEENPHLGEVLCLKRNEMQHLPDGHLLFTLFIIHARTSSAAS